MNSIYSRLATLWDETRGYIKTKCHSSGLAKEKEDIEAEIEAESHFCLHHQLEFLIFFLQ